MTIFFQNIVPNLLSLFIVSFLVSSACYLLIYYSNNNFLKFLHVPAAKSTTNAKLLGGFGTSLGMLTTLIYTYYFNYNSNLISTHESTQLTYFILPIAILTFYGYLDDKFEVRARYKLLFQFAAICTYAFYTANKIAPNHYIIGFFISMTLGLGFINGTNLLDGLDTLSIKIGIAASIGYLYLGIKSESIPTIFISTATIATLFSFYFFNKEPAKLYMGEIGGCVLGFIFYVQATITYEHLTNYFHGIHSFAYILIAGSLPICELGVSFIRRIWMKKSPFRGDKLHLHHILRSNLKTSASRTSSIIGAINFSSIIIGMLVAKYSLPIYGMIFTYTFTISSYTIICHKDWLKYKNQTRLENLFRYFENKTVHVIDSNILNKTIIQINQTTPIKTGKKKAA